MTTQTISIAISNPSPSGYYDATEREANGATDYDVTLRIGGVATEGVITLYRDSINGGMGVCGAPRDGWVSQEILRALHVLGERATQRVLGEVEAVGAELSRRGGDSRTSEITVSTEAV